jgi:hypothetical protein
MSEIKVIELQVKTNLDNANSGLGRFKTGLKEVSNQAKETTQSVTGMSKVEGTINAIGDGVGKLNPAFGAAVKGANGLILKMWEMVANPIGAILAGIVITAKFLYEAFQSSVAGGKELKTIFAGISAVGTQVKDALFGLGRALINVYTAAYKFITLDFAGAMESMKDANKEATESFKQLGNAADGTTFKIIKNLEKQQQANDKARKVQAVVQSETNKLLVQSREILTDETASIAAKKKALEEVTKAEKESSKEKVRIAAEDLRILKEKAVALGGEAEKKMKGEIREATIALNEAETENAMTGIKLNKQRKMLLRQESADAKAAADARIEQLKIQEEAEKKAYDERQKRASDLGKDAESRYDALLKAESDARERNRLALMTDQEKDLELINQKYDTQIQKAKEAGISTVALETAKLNELNDVNLKYQKITYDAEEENSKKKIANAKAEADAKKAIQDASFSVAEGGIGLIKNLFEKNKGIQKAAIIAENAIGIAKILINTNAANAAANLKYALVPGGQALAATEIALNKVSAGIGIASSVLATTKALSALGGGGAGGGNAPSGTASSGNAPQFNVVGATGVNQLAGAISNREQQPVQAYVVANNVTTAQGLDRNIIRSATLG